VLGKSIALARVDTAVAEPGRMLEIGQLDGLQKRTPVKVTSFPAYDPDKSRVRS
jgi:aminomethyltransferase